MDYINISNLIVFANHGVFDAEKSLGQKFMIDLKLGINLQHCAITGDLTKSVHYGILAEDITKLFKSKSNDLIETCAEEIAQFILKKYEIVEDVFVRVKKPWAPVMLPTDNIFIEIYRKRHFAFLGLGSNMGNLNEILASAVEMINDEYTTVVKSSKLYKTAPWGYTQQNDFLNQVIEISTTYEPLELLRHLQKIELDLGRKREIHWGPRTVDIDILFFDDFKMYHPDLIIPHPYISERQFVLEPMCDIAAHYIHPIFNKSMRVLFEELKANS